MIIVGLGFLGMLLSLFSSFALIGEGYGVLGAILLGLAALEAVVLVGLLKLQFWAFAIAIVVYSLGVILDLAAGQLFGPLISIVIVSYLLTISNRFDYSSP
ncbi:hypothetical protein [Natronolimnohabitans innermongolicus]|uniref:Uncharacterized protein n=1 Tax=Natronolimnohabitans innermongolicus JCM 12255 TaxID=1227499 RepID=L9XAG7_9EURY|nr:hypothetical protein [Natronolimnohabitans innermongolicus]ELY58744.1 hypothetical protein C493_06237 [Natronolimnohabitans innermongolicus JCM 12255]